MIKVIVASKNPVKVQVARDYFPKIFPGEKVIVDGVSVPSNVPDQPMSYEETLLGSLNRAYNARNAVKDADYWVGMEGGIEITNKGEDNERWETSAFIFVVDKEGNTGYSNTASVQLAPPVVALIKQGKELSHADDEVYGSENSGQGLGVTGILTGGVLPRIEYYGQAMMLALAPFKNKQYYFDHQKKRHE